MSVEQVQPLRLGKDSVAYRVLAKNPVAGLVAGAPALTLQVLHPAIGAGVYDHSTFKKRPINRLARTAEYVAGTGAASDEEALELIRRVNNRHKPVTGANDPELQVYVHVTEMWAILQAAKFLGAKLTPQEEDRYWAEVAPVGAYLGAPLELVPTNAAGAEALLARMRPVLEATPKGMDTVRFLLAPAGSKLFTALRPVLFLNRWATAALLPLEVRRLAGLRISPWRDRVARVVVRTLTTVGRPFFTRLTFHLIGPRATRYYAEFPERTTPRAFALPLPA